jgi:hypothetical protein
VEACVSNKNANPRRNQWLINEATRVKQIAQAELDRRGTTLSRQVEVSGHAIDRASTKLLDKWVATRLDKKEGLHHWLTRLASSALKGGPSRFGHQLPPQRPLYGLLTS